MSLCSLEGKKWAVLYLSFVFELPIIPAFYILYLIYEETGFLWEVSLV